MQCSHKNLLKWKVRGFRVRDVDGRCDEGSRVVCVCVCVCVSERERERERFEHTTLLDLNTQKEGMMNQEI